MEDFLPQTTRGAGTRQGHEANSLVVRGLVIFAVSLAAIIVAAELVLGFLMSGFSHEADDLCALAPPQFKDDAGLFPSPRLQADPSTELVKFKKEELDRLNGYGWVDERAGIAHVPIERAIDILAEKGLPMVSEASAAGKESAAPAPKGASARARNSPRPSRSRSHETFDMSDRESRPVRDRTLGLGM